MRELLVNCFLVILGTIGSRLIFTSLFKPTTTGLKALSYIVGGALAIIFYATWARTGLDPVQWLTCTIYSDSPTCVEKLSARVAKPNATASAPSDAIKNSAPDLSKAEPSAPSKPMATEEAQKAEASSNEPTATGEPISQGPGGTKIAEGYLEQMVDVNFRRGRAKSYASTTNTLRTLAGIFGRTIESPNDNQPRTEVDHKLKTQLDWYFDRIQTRHNFKLREVVITSFSEADEKHSNPAHSSLLNAEAIRHYLSPKLPGIDIHLFPRGDSEPVARSGTIEARYLNNRVLVDAIGTFSDRNGNTHEGAFSRVFLF